jgi:DNA topoisomerase-3
MKSLILTEKPSQGKEMAAGLGETFTGTKGYLESSSYIVTWAIGHLIELALPQEYNPAYEKWIYSDLPIIPEEFKYHVKADTSDQFKVIKSLLQRGDVDRVVEAGDPGREGELISRLVLRLAGNKKPVYRFWVSMALDAKTIRQGMANLKPAAAYDGLYRSAEARQQADWLIGMNASRALTIRMGETCSVGRVQTPTLSLIVKREQEIRNFAPQPYWVINALFSHPNGEYEGKYAGREIKQEEDPNTEGETKLLQKKEAEDIYNVCKEAKEGKVISVKTEKKSEKPPLLFSLTELQIAANKKFGLTADETLKLAQELYETDKAISYPRTESKYLSTNLATEINGILQKLAVTVNFDNSKINIDGNNKRIFDDSKFTDHHAIIPTGSTPKNTSDNKNKLFTLICERFIAAFYPDFKYTVTTAFTEVRSCLFKTTGKAVIAAGWKEVYGGIPKDVTMPVIKESDAVNVKTVTLGEKMTTPPARYSESDILKAMENISRFVTDEKYRKILKETAGLGTPATRAAIIEVLKKRFVTVEKGKLIPNPTGMKLIDILKESRIANPLYTAEMEQTLEEIAYQSGSKNDFMATAADYIREFIRWTSSLNIVPAERKSKYPVIGQCPVCKAEVSAFDKAFICKNNRKEGGNCNFILWRGGLEKLGKTSITDNEAVKLLSGQPLKVMLKKRAKKYSAAARLEKGERGYMVKVDFGKG